MLPSLPPLIKLYSYLAHHTTLLRIHDPDVMSLKYVVFLQPSSAFDAFIGYIVVLHYLVFYIPQRHR